MPSPPQWPAVTLTFNLWLPESNQVIRRGQWICPNSFINGWLAMNRVRGLTSLNAVTLLVQWQQRLLPVENPSHLSQSLNIHFSKYREENWDGICSSSLNKQWCLLETLVLYLVLVVSCRCLASVAAAASACRSHQSLSDHHLQWKQLYQHCNYPRRHSSQRR